MEYIIFDLEFNQGFDKKLNKTVSNEKCPFEIIQIGAIKLDSNLNMIDTFNEYVKPQIYKDIHPFIQKMTSITKNDVEYAKSFPQVFKEFKNFISSKKIVFGVWGTGDLKELYRNINYYNLPSKSLPKSYINIQDYASKYFKNPSGKSIGLQNAISILGLNQDKSYHDALNDAYYTSQVFIKINNPSIVPDSYVYTSVSPNKSTRKSKQEVDYEKLFNEFEKMLNRSITREEKKIIDLAYKMGKSNQFIKQSKDLKITYKKK